jgi:hypothetical protein
MRRLRLLGAKERGPPGWQFCSELITRVYQSYDIIPQKFNPEDVVPMDFFGFDKDGIPKICFDPIYINPLKQIIKLTV